MCTFAHMREAIFDHIVKKAVPHQKSICGMTVIRGCVGVSS